MTGLPQLSQSLILLAEEGWGEKEIYIRRAVDGNKK